MLIVVNLYYSHTGVQVLAVLLQAGLFVVSGHKHKSCMDLMSANNKSTDNEGKN